MEFRLLGRVEALDRNGRPVALGRRRERCLLGVLLLQANLAVPIERLISLLWEDDPPDNARATLRTYVSRLRAALAGGGPQLVNCGGGYRAELDPDTIDAHRFTRLVERARAETDLTYRGRWLARALALWRGPLLADVASDALRQRVGAELTELRQTATLMWVDAELDHGRHREIIGPLAAHVAELPFYEPLVDRLMLALDRAGRHAEALDTYQQLRARLAEAHGIDPGPDTERRYLAILRREATPVQTGEHRRQSAVPAQLPSPVSHFTGHTDALHELDNLLGGEAGPVVISAIAGTAGVGKTALAVHWAHRVADRFPDGQLYIDLRGYDSDRPLSPQTALDGFLRALGVPPAAIPNHVDARSAMFRSTLAGQRMLVVLDNARSAEQVRPLLPGGRGCRALVTSRDDLAGLVARDGAHRLTLDLLPETEAVALLRRIVGAARVDAEPDAAADLARLCARLPLALRVAAEQVARRSDESLAALVAELSDRTHLLDALDLPQDPATAVREVFFWSYRALSDGAAHLFRMLSWHSGPDIGAPAAASLAGIPPEQLRPLLAELVRAHLIAEPAPDRYVSHDLLRAYAAELAQGTEPAGLHRVLDHYARTGYAAKLQLNPKRQQIELPPPQPGVTPEDLAADGALAWFLAEHPVVMAAIDRAAEAGLDRYTQVLAWCLTDFFQRQGRWSDYAATQRAALDASQRLGDRAGGCDAERNLGLALDRLGRHEDALAHLRRALDGFVWLGDLTGQAHTHFGLGGLLQNAGRLHEATDEAERALQAYRRIGHRTGQGRALNAIGWCHVQLDAPERARQYCEEALTVLREAGDRRGESTTLDSLGVIHHRLGRHQEAIAFYRQALDMYVAEGDRYFQAETLTNLGDTHHAAGDDTAARQAWQQALSILDDLGHPEARAVRAKLEQAPTPR